MRRIPTFLKALSLAFGIELIAAFIWLSSGPYSSVPSLAGSLGWFLHAPGILLLLSVPMFSSSPDVVLFLFPPLLSLLLWFLLWWLFLILVARRRTIPEGAG